MEEPPIAPDGPETVDMTPPPLPISASSSMVELLLTIAIPLGAVLGILFSVLTFAPLCNVPLGALSRDGDNGLLLSLSADELFRRFKK